MKIEKEIIEQLLYVKTKISDDDLCEIKNWSLNYLESECLKIARNNELAGAIENEFLLPINIHQKLNPYALELVKNFEINTTAHNDIDTYKNYEIIKSWINFQKKYEYNPFHVHSGEFSFVLWVNIPYNLNEELNLPNCINSNDKKNSLFEFEYHGFEANIIGNPIEVDKSFEGTMILFPSKLRHCVYPFYTSDDYRISISGNLVSLGKQNTIKLEYQ